MSQVITSTSAPLSPKGGDGGRGRGSATATPFIEHFARFGFAIKGVVYCIIGLLAALAPIGIGTRPTGTQGALRTLLQQPVGSLLMAIIAAGMGCFGVFQLLRAIEDPDRAGRDARGIARRIGWAWNALVHFGFLAVALAMLVGLRRVSATAGADDERRVRDWTATAMSYPLGRWAVAAVGVGIIVYGVLQIRSGAIGKLDKWLSFLTCGETTRRWARGVSRFGVAARGVVFALIGAFLIRAAYDFNPHVAKGLGGTLRALSAEPHGAWLLGIVALGLVAYGMYDFVLARYRRINQIDRVNGSSR
jgi:hypothetical protein